MRFCSSDAARTTWNAPSKDTALKFADASPMLFTAPALFIISKPQLTDQSVFLASSSVKCHPPVRPISTQIVIGQSTQSCIKSNVSESYTCGITRLGGSCHFERNKMLLPHVAYWCNEVIVSLHQMQATPTCLLLHNCSLHYQNIIYIMYFFQHFIYHLPSLSSLHNSFFWQSLIATRFPHAKILCENY